MATTSVIDRAVPGAGPLGDVLSTVLQLCGDMKEGKYACNSLHARLKGVLDELQTVEECGQRPGEKSLHQFVAIVSKFLRFLERHRESSLVFRLVAYDKMAEEQQQVSDDIAQLFEELGVVTVNWEEQWEHDTRIQKDVLVASAMDSATILRDLTDPRACVEAALTLKFEMQQRAEQHNGEIMECIKSMMGIIAADSRAKVTELPPWSIPSYEVTFDPTPFARGSFGSVHRGVWGPEKSNVVVKRLFCDDLVNDERIRHQVERELSLLHELSHPNITKMFGASHANSPPFVWEHAAKGNLGVLLCRYEGNKQYMWRLLYEAGLGLEYLHQRGIMHGNLKLNNILIGEDGHAKLSDFGMGAVRASSRSEVSAARVSSTLRWSAPECLTSRPVFASDIYSFALCMIEAVTGEPPFVFLSDDDVRDNVRKGIIPSQPEEMAADVWELIVSMTSFDPNKRPPLHHVLDKLKAFDKLLESASVERNCGACRSVMLSGPRFCSQCGAMVGEQASDPAVLDACSTESSESTSPPAASPGFELEEPDAVSGLQDPNVYVADLEDSKPVLAIDSSIPELLTTIQTGNAARCEQALLLLLQVGSDDQKENAVRALANLTMNNERSCAEITNEGAIPVLMELLGTGIGVQKGLAALTLGFLGATNKANSTVLRDAGALGLLVDLLRTEGIEQEQHAVTALEHLTAHNNENLKAVAREDVIAPLVSVLQVGSDTQKELGTVVLGRLAGTQASREKIAAEGVIPLLVGLVRTGTNAQKEEAAHVLGRLAKDETKAVIKSLGAIGILQELQQTGTTGQKRKARVALKAISEDDGGTSKRRRSAPNQTLCFSAIQKGVSMPSSPHSIEELSGGGTLGLEQGVYFIMSFANPKVGANKGVDHEAQWGYCGRDVL
ncbi:hypothetical protein PF005_g7196 [Phytophthora fragariae]|uniref:Protein kinase domain-containing protein n=1 Tax=Phytophthora fragariae TaxID=53985 RepID=A0A6A3YM47_9STRA|nr:hypothetical protein PF009_g7898 [Phytophthora fragariae]KAE9019828.1 hypothetical protein PF011_g5668 [Phytophthora fragariae]KAE9122763.1 hypothetical protein PF007_g7319 [Phytophthora fragariae]KAE9221206.1 hypothetical protein PF005_g7196 [Phytophthora fragariae]KAE9317944.1 hypothetical protein PF001_g6601 [Phytophthora fragariae]